MVSGMRSPPSSTRTMTNWPGLRAWATRGACDDHAVQLRSDLLVADDFEHVETSWWVVTGKPGACLLVSECATTLAILQLSTCWKRPWLTLAHERTAARLVAYEYRIAHKRCAVKQLSRA